MSSITFLQWNCRSLIPKIDSFKQLTHKLNCDAFALSETWLKSDIDLSFRDYNVIRQDRPSDSGKKSGGGVLIGIRKCHSFYRVQLSNLGPIEAVACQARIRGMDVCIVSVYVPPEVSDNGLNLCPLVDCSPSPRLILGDFNSHSQEWGCRKDDARSKLILDLCDNFDMQILNTGEMTRISSPATEPSAIDLTLCSNSMALDCEWNVIQDPHGSDHLPITIRVTGQQPLMPVEISYDLTRNIDWKQYAEIISTGIDTGDELSPLEEYAFLASLIYDSAIQAQTKPVPGPNFKMRPPNPWWDKECTELSAVKSEAFIEFRKTGTRASFEKYQALERRWTKVCKAKKRGYWRQFVVGLPAETSMSTLWKIAKSMRNRSCTNEDVEYSDKWIFAFAKKVCPDSVPALPTFQVVDGNDTNPPFSMIELSMALLSCNNTAPGPDRIKFSLLKNLPDLAKRRLLALFNKLLEQNIIPHEWRQVRVVAIQKPGKPASDHNSYRPICMLSCLRKLLEKMILVRLEVWAESNNLLSDTQFGFRRGKGTNDCLALLSTEAEIAYGKKQQMASVFLDIKGAFDNVSIEVLAEKMRSCNLPPLLCNFLTNILSEKHMNFSHGSSSTIRTSYMGLPQGSRLSPFLYNFYVSDIDDCMIGGCTLRQLADDAVVSFTANKSDDLLVPLQATLDNLTCWAVRLGIEFSSEKTELVVFSRKHNPAQLNLSLSGKTISQSMTFKYLGVWFDAKGTWGPHIRYLKRRCVQRINFLRSITGTWWGANPTDLLRLYKTTILSILEYGSFCFRSAAKSHLLVLERIQYRCLRIVLGCMHSTHNMSLELLAGVLPLQLRFYELSYRFLIRCEIRNPLVIDNFEVLLYLEVRSRRMILYYDFMSTDINPCRNAQIDSAPPLICSTSICFDISMKSETHGIPDHLLPSVVPKIFASKYNHIPQRNMFFTDGSRISDCTGFGVFNESHEIFKKLNDPCSVYVAELAAIHCALNIIADMTPDQYYIFTDSLSSVEAIRSLQPTRQSSYFLMEIRKTLNALAARSFSIFMVWVPSHCSIPGNEEADVLAKRGAAEGDVFERPIGFEEYYGIPRQRVLACWQSQWDDGDLGRWTHSIRPIVSTKAWFKGLDLTRNFIRMVSRLMSNHYTSKAHLFRIKLSDTNLCDCGQGYQDIDHIVWSCPEHRNHRKVLQDTLRARGRPPEIPIREILASLDLNVLSLVHHFLKDSKVSI